MLLASMSLGAASCAKENTAKTNDGGKPTTMTISMNFPKMSQETRTATDSNAIDAEAAVKTVDVFVFNDTGAYQSHTALQATDFTANGGDSYSTTAPIATTTGKKSVLVGVNIPTATAASLEGQVLGRVSTAIKTLNVQKSAYDIATNGLPMFSSTVAEKTMDTDTTTNTVNVQVKRIVAKVTVEKEAGFVQEGGGTMGTLSFAINNQNTKYFLLQGAAPYQDPNWSSTSYDSSSFVSAVDADYVAVADSKPADITGYNALYALENTSDAKTGAELTRVEVQATYIPAKVITAYTKGTPTSATESNNPNLPSTVTTFYKVTTAAGDIIYANDQTIANDFHTDHANSVLETYTNGICYWYFFLNKSGSAPNQWDVLRNDYYQCSISRVVAPGHSTPQLTTAAAGVTPLDDTSMNVNVNILPWNTPVQDSYVLEP